jgi:hypothetical protein
MLRRPGSGQQTIRYGHRWVGTYPGDCGYGYLLLTSKEAFIEEAMALRLQEADTLQRNRWRHPSHGRFAVASGRAATTKASTTRQFLSSRFGSANLDKVA